MTSMIDKLEKHIEENLENALNDLKEFVRIPSIATKNQGIVEAAEFLKSHLSSAGVKVKIHNTSGSPVVTGHLDVGAKRAPEFI